MQTGQTVDVRYIPADPNAQQATDEAVARAHQAAKKVIVKKQAADEAADEATAALKATVDASPAVVNAQTKDDMPLIRRRVKMTDDEEDTC